MPTFVFSRLQTIVFASLTFASSALAGVYVTNPVANTTASPGQLLSIRWVDDGSTPHLATIGPSQIALFTGSATQQTFLQELAASIDVSTSNSLDAWIDSSIGPNGNYYFVRVLSLELKDAVQPQYPYQSYSARFTLNNMSGSFNSSVWQQLEATTLATSAGTFPTSSSSGSRSGGSSASSSKTSSSSTKGSAGSEDGGSETVAPTAGETTGGTKSGTGSGVTGVGAGTGSSVAGVGAGTGSLGSPSAGKNTVLGNTVPTSSSVAIVSKSPASSTTAPTTSSSSAAASRLSAPFAFKAPSTLGRISQPGSPEGRTATLMVTSVLIGVFGFGLAIAL